MKLAFSMLSHRPPDALFIKLLTWLKQFPQVTIAIHHDYSKSNFPQELIERFDLQMVQPYHKTQWGHISKLPAIIDTFKKLNSCTPDFDWLISISPNRYPVKSRKEILEFLSSTDMDYFMENHPLGIEYGGIYKWHYQALFTKWLGKIPWITRKGRFRWKHIRIPVDRQKTPFNDSMFPHAGSDWYIFNNKTVKRIIEADMMQHPMVKYITQANKAPDRNSSPDEVIFQTYVKNQKDLIGSGNYHRFIDWKDAKDWHPNTITAKHWADIKNSDALFARKFDPEESKEVIDLIDTHILNYDDCL